MDFKAPIVFDGQVSSTILAPLQTRKVKQGNQQFDPLEFFISMGAVSEKFCGFDMGMGQSLGQHG